MEPSDKLWNRINEFLENHIFQIDSDYNFDTNFKIKLTGTKNYIVIGQETKFIEYEDYDEFKADGSFNVSGEGKQKGVMLYFLKNGSPCYEYAPLNINEKDFTIWESEMMNKYDNMTWRKNIYWKLEKLSCVLVLRNRKWFQDNVGQIQKIWKTIEQERVTGYEHRAPVRKIKKEPIIEEKQHSIIHYEYDVL